MRYTPNFDLYKLRLICIFNYANLLGKQYTNTFDLPYLLDKVNLIKAEVTKLIKQVDD